MTLATRAPVRTAMCRWLVFGGLSLLPFGCAPEIEGATQIVVSVDSDLAPGTELSEIAIDILKADGSEVGRRTLGPVAIASPEESARSSKASFPLSFTVTPGNEPSVMIRVVGTGVHGASSTPRALVTERAIVSFRRHRTQLLRVYLGRVCIDQSCAGNPSLVCYPTSFANVAAGQCGGVAARTSRDTVSDVEPQDLPGLLGRPAGAPPAGDAGTGADAGSEEQVRVCESPNLCTFADYPCVSTQPDGYTCRGQLADWRMPDARPGSASPPSYDLTTVPGLVIDRVTGLQWQRDLPAVYTGCTGTYEAGSLLGAAPRNGDACSWREAKAYCEQLTLAGRDDFRLPSKIELESIVDETRFGPSINLTAFPQTPDNGFWTSSPYKAKADNAWAITFSFGDAREYPVGVSGRVRCVH